MAQFGRVLGQLGQAGLVGRAQLGVVAHRIEMADRTPGTVQALVQFVERQHQPIPARCARLLLEQFGNGGAILGKQLIHRRLDMLRADDGIGWQVEGLQQWVVGGHDWAPVTKWV
jgi:hypothetical protein